MKKEKGDYYYIGIVQITINNHVLHHQVPETHNKNIYENEKKDLQANTEGDGFHFAASKSNETIKKDVDNNNSHPTVLENKLIVWQQHSDTHIAE